MTENKKHKYVPTDEMFCCYLEKHKKWGLHIVFFKNKECPSGEVSQEMSAAAPFLCRIGDDSYSLKLWDIDAFLESKGYFIFDHEEDMLSAFNSCRGEDRDSIFSCYACAFGQKDDVYKELFDNS